ncbi:universal stress protein [Burkholderia multivorans]|jgi:nucleotide-binding universal stress UspA family protein|uniref:UspA domain-containing protein n=1 Tax=Burkholderia multivorans TaxID=87883 RepID=A0AB37AZA4_9BURK|nr:universal stress protein [Burkholderia multivorans]PRE49522.1 hypothetical protein C6P97_12525 [Burkholderia multivorans]PRE55968.1 hypothetical protein C6P99_00955 [Burkholderia multivorans]
MDKIVACIDGSRYTESIGQYAVWACQRLGAPLEFLHTLERHPERAQRTDPSGTIGFGSQEKLLVELSALDEQRGKLAQEHGRLMLQSASDLARAAGLTSVSVRQRHGDLVNALAEMEQEIRLVVLGKHGPLHGTDDKHLGAEMERVTRTLRRPTLIASEAFRPIKKALIAFDGSATGQKMIETVAASPLLRALPCHVLTVGQQTPGPRDELEWAATRLSNAGLIVTSARREGHPERAIALYMVENDIDLLVMGAYGHSRIRELIVGSTTTALLRESLVPVLVLR